MEDLLEDDRPEPITGTSRRLRAALAEAEATIAALEAERAARRAGRTGPYDSPGSRLAAAREGVDEARRRLERAEGELARAQEAYYAALRGEPPRGPEVTRSVEGG